jgi:hypothetical protein
MTAPLSPQSKRLQVDGIERGGSGEAPCRLVCIGCLLGPNRNHASTFFLPRRCEGGASDRVLRSSHIDASGKSPGGSFAIVYWGELNR